jgi:hypothetical protein
VIEIRHLGDEPRATCDVQSTGRSSPSVTTLGMRGTGRRARSVL